MELLSLGEGESGEDSWGKEIGYWFGEMDG